MRYALLALLFVVPVAVAGADPASPLIMDAEAEARALEYRLYEQVDFPLRARRIESDIKLTEARRKSLQKILAEYQTFQKFSLGNPLTLTVEETKLQILEAELRLEALREERSLLQRYQEDQKRLFLLRRSL